MSGDGKKLALCRNSAGIGARRPRERSRIDDVRLGKQRYFRGGRREFCEEGSAGKGSGGVLQRGRGAGDAAVARLVWARRVERSGEVWGGQKRQGAQDSVSHMCLRHALGQARRFSDAAALPGVMATLGKARGVCSNNGGAGEHTEFEVVTAIHHDTHEL